MALLSVRGARKKALPGIKLSHDRVYSPNLVEGSSSEVGMRGPARARRLALRGYSARALGARRPSHDLAVLDRNTSTCRALTPCGHPLPALQRCAVPVQHGVEDQLARSGSGGLLRANPRRVPPLP